MIDKSVRGLIVNEFLDVPLVPPSDDLVVPLALSKNLNQRIVFPGIKVEGFDGSSMMFTVDLPDGVDVDDLKEDVDFV